MVQVIVQPASNKDSQEHFENSIRTPVDRDIIFRYVTDINLQNEIDEYYQGDSIPVWGVTLGKNDINKVKWDRAQPGDKVLFYKDKTIVASGLIAFKFQNERLAEHLWGRNTDGNTWELIYLLDNVQKEDVPISLYNEVLGYKPNYIIQGFNVLKEDKSSAVLEGLELYTVEDQAKVNLMDFKEVPSFKGETDEVVSTTRRREQGLLRNYLFPNGQKLSECAICHNEYPVAFLVAAHLKKRNSCTEEERTDFQNIALPMCKCGCDELYEKGYIYVENGRIYRNENIEVTTSKVEDLIKAVVDNKVLGYREESEKYFESHKELAKRSLSIK